MDVCLHTMHDSEMYWCRILTLWVLTVHIYVRTFQQLDDQFHIAVVSSSMKSGVASI